MAKFFKVIGGAVALILVAKSFIDFLSHDKDDWDDDDECCRNCEKCEHCCYEDE